MDSSWMDAWWTVWVDRAILIVAAAGLLVVALGLALTVLAPQKLQNWPFLYGVKRPARTRMHAGIEFVLWLALLAGVVAGSLSVARPGWTLLTPLVLVGLVVFWIATGSRAGRRAG